METQPPVGSDRRRYGELTYRMRILVDTISWATGIKASHIVIALLTAAVLAIGGAVTGTVILFTNHSQHRIRPGDGTLGPAVSTDEDRLQAEQRVQAGNVPGKVASSMQPIGHGGISGLAGGSSGSGGSWSAGSAPGGPLSGGPAGAGSSFSGSFGSSQGGAQPLPIYRPEDGDYGQQTTQGGSGAEGGGKTQGGQGTGGGLAQGQRPQFRQSQLTDLSGRGTGAQTTARWEGMPGTAGQAGEAGEGMSQGGGGGGMGPAGGSRGSKSKGPLPLAKVPEITGSGAVANPNTPGRMPKTSHKLPQEPGKDKDKEAAKPEGSKDASFDAKQADSGQKQQEGKAWEIYLDKSKAHDLSDGKGVHEAPQEPGTIGIGK